MFENENNDLEKDEYAAARKTFQLLKFTPCTYRLEILDCRYDVAIGPITPQQYDHWSEPDNQQTLYDMCQGRFKNGGVPDHLMLGFDKGYWWENNDLVNITGCMLFDGNSRQQGVLVIYDEKNKVIFTSSMDKKTLTNHGIQLESTNNFSFDDLSPGESVFVGITKEYAGHMECKIPLDDDFDLSSLTLVYSIVNGDSYITEVRYKNADIEDISEFGCVDFERFYVYQA